MKLIACGNPSLFRGKTVARLLFILKLNAFFLLVDEPEAYGLPREPKLPTRNLVKSSMLSTLGAVVMTTIGALTLRAKRIVAVAKEKAK